MENIVLNVVSLDVPFPPDYGGAADIFYRLKALKLNGCKIVLHCYEYGRGRNHNYREIADEIIYYDRKINLFSFLSKEPMIVKSRRSRQLIENLKRNDYPILLEGQHCTFLLEDERLQYRKVFVRIHNIEWQHYENLAQAARSWFRRIYYTSESKKLKKHEPILKKANAVFALSESDRLYYKEINPKAFFWNAGFDFSRKAYTGAVRDQYLFHANLSVAENREAADYLISFWNRNNIQKKLIIAGKNPDKNIVDKASDKIEIIENPDDLYLAQLIQSSKCNLLLTFRSAGVKVRLFNALSLGNVCIVNSVIVKGTGLEQFCEVFNNEAELTALINADNLSFDKAKREDYMKKALSPAQSASNVLKILFDK